MDLTLIIGFILLIVVIIGLIFKLIKAVVKAIIVAAIFIVIIVFLLGMFTYSDVNKIKDKIGVSDNIFLITDDGNVLSGGIMSGESKPVFLTKEEITSAQDALENDGLKDIKEDYFKIFLVDLSTFEEVEQITVAEKSYSKEQAFELLRSDNPIDKFIEDNQEYTAEEIREEIGSDDTAFKAGISFLLFENAGENNVVFILENYKKGNIEVYPETIAFKLLKIIPVSLVNKLMNKEQK